jgi:hypothetical protein
VLRERPTAVGPRKTTPRAYSPPTACLPAALANCCTITNQLAQLRAEARNRHNNHASGVRFCQGSGDVRLRQVDVFQMFRAFPYRIGAELYYLSAIKSRATEGAGHSPVFNRFSRKAVFDVRERIFVRCPLPVCPHGFDERSLHSGLADDFSFRRHQATEWQRHTFPTAARVP